MRMFIIADDLTGANDSAAQLRRCGLTANVTIYPFNTPLHSSCDVLVLDTESRDLPPAQARTAVRAACDYIQSQNVSAIIYKKVDSTLRGHVGAELETVMQCLSLNTAVFAPAFPESGRTTIHGRQLLNGIPLENTELALIPKSPVNTSYIPDILRHGTSLQTRLIPLDTPLTALNAFASNSNDNQVLIVDAQNPQDLMQAAAYAYQLRPCLIAGSAGLARALSKSPCFTLTSNVSAPAQPLSPVKRLLILSGSISAVSQKQCQVLRENTACKTFLLDPEGALASPETEAQRLAALIATEAANADCVLVSGALSPDDVAQCRHTAEKMQLSFFTAGERYAKTMAALMRLIAQDFAGYVMTGGDTAVHACRAVQADVLQLEGEMENGIAACRIVSGPLQDRILVSKAGAFGTPQTFLHVYQALIMHQ